VLEWASPAWFLALPVVVVPWWAWLRPHRLRFTSTRAVRTGGSVRALLAILVPLLESLALLGGVIALARPQDVTRETVRETPGIDILLALDTSCSMNETDMSAGGVALSRLEAAKQVMARFVEARRDDRVGLLLFGDEAFVQVPLTLDHAALNDFIGQVEIGMAGRNATAVGTAIAVGTKRMKDLKAPSRVMVLVTDGRSNAGTVTPLIAAKAAAALGVKVYTIGVGGGRGGSVLGVFRANLSDIDEPTLRAVATTTGARFYRATDAAGLDEVYAEIDRLEESPGRSREFVHRDERYLEALLPALACLAGALSLSHGLLRRIP
jgi:Ca-activated chloride channel family protein